MRIYLAEKGIAVERVMIDLRADEQLGDAYLAVNPRGMVPALQLDDGEVICESAAICRYFEALHPDPPLFGRTPLEIARIESMTRRIENEGYAAAVYVLRNGSPAFVGRGAAGKWPEMAQIPQLAARGLVMWDMFVEMLDQELATRPWMTGEAYSFADITALATIDFAKAAKLMMPESAQNLRRWHAAASNRPSAKA
ncbi:MAG: glutathione S-transferase family protein [Candidatus Sphingomonas colombiensis]|nr:glutathione S-transferase family protein [Sphingomonas sp.]WEK43715.1 MAG: glutathione S-transferase family protein [Sphingomonas sp.]